MEDIEEPQTPTGIRKRRKLRHPRTAKACLFCRKRKVRCSGTHPCEYCIREEVPCDFGPDYHPINTPRSEENSTVTSAKKTSISQRLSGSNDLPANSSQRSSLEPPQTFDEGEHVGSISGVSFLYHSWNTTDKLDDSSKSTHESTTSTTLLSSYGDCPQPALSPKELDGLQFSSEHFNVFLERYFRFATPTYRFLHQPTIHEWAKLFVIDNEKLSSSRKACLLIASAQSLLHAPADKRDLEGTSQDVKISRLYFEKAKALLDTEQGPPSLASVQARLAMCLYLMSTFRMNECRYCFSFAITILTSLGLHRKQSSNLKNISLVESESRKRTFWCAYVLDGYLSVMLGRPRILRDEDIDQPYPLNIDDQDLLSSESTEELPMHGNLEAFIGHASLAKLMAKNSDMLYPIESLSEDQILQRSCAVLDDLEVWRNNLPEFLKPKNKTLTGQRTFERQNTVLKLASAHLRILATRRSLLTDFKRLGKSRSTHPHDDRSLRPVKDCVDAIETIIDCAYSLKECGTLYESFWFTQYVTVVAISTLYVFIIQGVRGALPGSMSSLLDVDKYFNIAEECQLHLAAQAPEGSQAKRHHQLLDLLRSRVEKDLTKSRRQATMVPSSSTDLLKEHHTPPDASNRLIAPKIPSAPSLINHSSPIDYLQSQAVSVPGMHAANLFGAFTPSSESDESFRNMLGTGWEALDTIGFMEIADNSVNFML